MQNHTLTLDLHKMVQRTMMSYVQKLAQQYPIITILGPRQAGKTTLAKNAFPDKVYVNLEHPMTREFAEEDPIGFLSNYPDGAIFDEIQRVPKLLSYIQVIVDEKDVTGYFILTGSHQFELRNSISQSLAGRTTILKLLPFSIKEIGNYKNYTTDELLFRGFYPRVYEKGINPTQAYGDYLETYIERDLRQLIMIRDLSTFQKFMRLIAGRVGQLLNISNLANDTGVSQSTVKEWISILEASFVCFLLQPWQPTIRKRLIRSPKLYFYDVGLATMLLGIENEKQIPTHPLRGNLYENLIIADVLKYRYNRGLRNNLMFYRDSNGNEVDLLFSVANNIIPIEIKSGQTVNSGYFKGLRHFNKKFSENIYKSIIVYDGDIEQEREDTMILNSKKIVTYISELNL